VNICASIYISLVSKLKQTIYLVWFGVWRLTPLSTTLQLHWGGRVYWWR